MTFKDYLQSNKLRESTIKGHLQDIERFKKWCKKRNTNYINADYNELLEFIRETRARGVSKSSVNIHLNSISKYYDYLTETGNRNDNPAKDLRLKNTGKKVLQHLLTTQELEEIYTSYANKPEWSFSKGEKSKRSHIRNTVILGLMIYQGIQTQELKKIEKNHLNLLQGTIYIPSSCRSAGRILKLNAKQIIPMQQYLRNIEINHEKLFNCKITSVVSWLMTTLIKQNEKACGEHSRTIKNAGQTCGELSRTIRSSVIINWLKQHNIRQVQYMAGHKHIGSTERYKQEDLQDLQLQLNLFHPLK